MDAYPIKLTYHVRDYYFGERLIPDILGKRDAPEGVVAEIWEISDYKDTTGKVRERSLRWPAAARPHAGVPGRAGG
jgi:mannose-6-phosphate isomerase class I